MELKESIDYLKNCLDDEWDFKNATREKDKQAINTVLEELNNRIPRKDIEDKINELKEKLENVRNKEDRIRNGIAIIVLEYCIDIMNELLNKE